VESKQPSPNTERYRKKAEDIKRRLDELIDKYCARKEYRQAEDLRPGGKISVADDPVPVLGRPGFE
jgi:hypothetical protein